MIELVFSFILSTWGGMGVVQEWADSHLGGVSVLTDRIYQQQQILCTLERQGLLVYDGQWKEKFQLQIPAECLKEASAKVPNPVPQINFRSVTLASVPNVSSWDQRIDIRMKDQQEYSLYFRQDKHHVGVHSTGGWSMWVERKKGDIRFEMTHLAHNPTHFRLKVNGSLNPLKGVLSDVSSVEALHVYQEKGKVQRAYILVGKKHEGFTEVAFRRDNKGLKRVAKSEVKKGFNERAQETWASKVGESELARFSDVSSKQYRAFLMQGSPLAFNDVNPEQTVPETAIFR